MSLDGSGRLSVSMMTKRLLDVVAVLVVGPLIVPLCAAIALLIAADSRGGVLFRQQRIGRHARPFQLIKFRTMLQLSGDSAGRFDAGSVARVTRVGGFLRRTKLDELPQLWNVLKGDMSLVGPRPEVPKWTTVYPERWAVVHTVRPGLTDPASIKFRNEEDLLRKAANPEDSYRDVILPEKLRLAEEYVATRSFLGDLSIIAQTAAAIVGRGTKAKRESTSLDLAKR